MTAGGSAVVDAPRWSATGRELDDLQCLLLGAYGPLRAFTAPAAGGGGTPTLAVPADVAAAALAARALDVLDEEGALLGRVLVESLAPVRDDTVPGDTSSSVVLGPVEAAGSIERGAYHHLHRPAPVGQGSVPLLAVPVVRPLLRAELVAVRACADDLGAGLLLLPLTGHRRGALLDPAALVRMCLGVAPQLQAEVVPVPVPGHGDPAADAALALQVAGAYGATAVPRTAVEWSSGSDRVPLAGLPPVGVEVVEVADMGDLVEVTLAAVAADQAVDVDVLAAPAARELHRAHRLGAGRGFAVLLTGLSGSGKSTVARALAQALLEHTDRSVTLLDGDVVRRLLSAGLTFSRADRELNVRRIGYVAAEVARHGGVALCAPIAPYAALRDEVRSMVEQQGGFLLVHVATPLEVCEARDRKGLYARARAGLIPEFTGISDPYETPVDADIRFDTAQVDVDAAVISIIEELTRRGWLRPAE